MELHCPFGAIAGTQLRTTLKERLFQQELHAETHYPISWFNWKSFQSCTGYLADNGDTLAYNMSVMEFAQTNGISYVYYDNEYVVFGNSNCGNTAGTSYSFNSASYILDTLNL